MRIAKPIASAILALGTSASSAAAQDGLTAPAVESWKIGASGAAGFPAFAGGLRVSAPLGPKGGVDFAAVRLGGGHAVGSSPGYIAHVRWMRGGRKPSGGSRYWIFGAMWMRQATSTTYIFPGHVVQTVEDRHTLVIPRFGYGWDHVDRHGTRVGFEATTGAAGEEQGFIFANVFVMWGPPRGGG
ncbi:MAG TPA: hypothetical protein VL225_06615 [Vicinamibacterales bacterium]|jgi:hypothetical protein|nr:hypothetical protein [Vicinamibacterales bacterium]